MRERLGRLPLWVRVGAPFVVIVAVVGSWLTRTGAAETDKWLVVATFFGPVAAAVLAIAFGANRYRAEQELRDVRRYLVDEGALRLKGSLDAWLEITRRNYVVAHHLLRYVRDVPYNHPLRPRIQDLPKLFPVDVLSFNFEAIAPASRLIGAIGIGELMTRAFSNLYNINLTFQTQIGQPIRSYYARRALPQDIDRPRWYEQLSELVERQYRRAELYGPVSRWLEDAALRVQELHISRFDEVDRIHGDELIVQLRSQIANLLAEMQREDQ